MRWENNDNFQDYCVDYYEMGATVFACVYGQLSKNSSFPEEHVMGLHNVRYEHGHSVN
jgi:hypothetical protein